MDKINLSINTKNKENINKTKQNRPKYNNFSKNSIKNVDMYGMSTPNFTKNIKTPFEGFNFWTVLSKLLSDLGKMTEAKPKVKNVSFCGNNSMLDEIKEQPAVIDKLVNRYLPLNKPVQEIKLNLDREEINNLSKIYIVASGSSKNVGKISKYIIERIARIPVEVDYASEFAHRDLSLKPNDLVIAISQSGETADTFAAVKAAKENGVHTLALTNNPESKINNISESQMNVGAGKEKSIAATKSVTAQLINLYALALYLGEERGTISSEESNKYKQELHKISKNLDKVLGNVDKITLIADKIKDSQHLVLLGRGVNLAVAQEGALKIKETSYIDANGYPSGEFMHGHKAVIDEKIPVISIIVPGEEGDPKYKYAINNTVEVKNNSNTDLVIIKSEKDKDIENNPVFKDAMFIDIPECEEKISPLYTLITLQLLALKIAEGLGRDVDQPRYLKKAVTNE